MSLAYGLTLLYTGCLNGVGWTLLAVGEPTAALVAFTVALPGSFVLLRSFFRAGVS